MGSVFSTPGREEMFNREEMDWNIYQYYDVKMFRPDSSEGFLQPSSSLAALNDSEDIIKTMIKRERNRIAATKCREKKKEKQHESETGVLQAGGREEISGQNVDGPQSDRGH